MASSPRALLCWWFCLWLSCRCLVAEGSGERPGGFAKGSIRGGGRRSRAAETEAVEQPSPPVVVSAAADKVSEHMLRLYVRYSGRSRDSEAAGTSRLFHLREGNTVRSFRALPAGILGHKEVYVFNLTSLTKSENILSALLHYYVGDLQNGSTNCPQHNSCSLGLRKPDLQIKLLLLSFPSPTNQSRTLGRYVVNVSASLQDDHLWQCKNITWDLRRAKEHNHLMIGVQMASLGQPPWKSLHLSYEPYILVYANDSAISEPESVVSSLQGHWNPPPGTFPKLDSQSISDLSGQRPKRSTSFLLPLQNNELPGAEYQYSEDDGWEERKHYKTLQPRLAERSKGKKKPRKHNHQKSQTLQFDEQTLKKARRKQWNEPRSCSRRYLKVDFADIGWSEWIISPKAFDAFYCSGECQFPIPKALKPSNHATIQSIVRAVGVVSGIPEPCCVPDKMTSLSILFFDENKNVVLKVYPNMTVESCACR
ncbi:bone morphogenetic protein 3 isoform X1 [Ahaetulla prasina]|uniref:bone morphogenetic protein 3 isoform X1 n=1 Tax=Ahaetulla prasina TaxID=499056 RepID=UPI002647F03B|nr:bone morphogenetic protein 3 isoform X1 [Ahaetulla prasina]